MAADAAALRFRENFGKWEKKVSNHAVSWYSFEKEMVGAGG